jgi:hypothetical protein
MTDNFASSNVIGIVFLAIERVVEESIMNTVLHTHSMPEFEGVNI